MRGLQGAAHPIRSAAGDALSSWRGAGRSAVRAPTPAFVLARVFRLTAPGRLLVSDCSYARGLCVDRWTAAFVTKHSPGGGGHDDSSWAIAAARDPAHRWCPSPLWGRHRLPALTTASIVALARILQARDALRRIPGPRPKRRRRLLRRRRGIAPVTDPTFDPLGGAAPVLAGAVVVAAGLGGGIRGVCLSTAESVRSSIF